MAVLKVIIEGCNQSGKSSVVQELEKMYTESIVTVIHGYYHPAVVEHFGSDLKAMAEYGRKRLFSFLPVFRDVKFEEVLFLRLHLTDMVYLKLFHEVEADYPDLEKDLDEQGVALVLLDLNDEELEKRMSKRLAEGKTGSWDKDMESVKSKRDAYRWAFEKSRMKRKLLLDTSGKSAEQNAQAILEWF